MTDKQIEQNAEAYAIKKTLTSTDSFHGMVENYLAGAHSRDKEVKELLDKNAEYFMLAEYWKKRANRLKNRLTKKGEQIAELKKGE